MMIFKQWLTIDEFGFSDSYNDSYYMVVDKWSWFGDSQWLWNDPKIIILKR